MKHCHYCGRVVSDRDWDYVGDRKVYLCDAPQCQRDLRDDNRGVDEEAQYQAERDNYDRYR